LELRSPAAISVAKFAATTPFRSGDKKNEKVVQTGSIAQPSSKLIANLAENADFADVDRRVLLFFLPLSHALEYCYSS